MRRRLFRAWQLALLLAATATAQVTVTAAETVSDFTVTPTETVSEVTGTSTETVCAEDSLPTRWFAGDFGKLPTVKNQGSLGTCWALTAVSALEAALLPDLSMEFSADHLSLQNAFTASLSDGGDYLMVMAYLSGWQGPVLEADDPYGDGESPEDLEAVVHVQEIQVLFEAEIEEIKQAVRSYGAVQTSLYLNRASVRAGAGYYNEAVSSYYIGEEKTANHDVLIVGWDDDWSARNFTTDPGMDGAWICLNTWGEDFGENGLFYVSYADANIGAVSVCYTKIETTDNYDCIYQYDDCGWQGQQGYDASNCWFANVYTAVQDETLAAAGFYATSRNTTYELYLVHDFVNTDSFGEMQFLQSGSFTEVGYYTVELTQEVPLAAGERFAVVVYLVAPEATNPVAVEYRADEYTQNVTTEGKESYLSQYGTTWQNTQEKFETNVCLKAYTRVIS